MWKCLVLVACTLVATVNAASADLTINQISLHSKTLLSVIRILRAGELDGAADDDYDSYDGYDEEEDDEDIEERPRPDRPKNHYDHKITKPPRNQKRASKESHYDHRMATPPRRPSQKKQKHWAQRAVSQSVQMGSKAAWNTVKLPGKLGIELLRPKHVDPRELQGLWRLDQQITEKGDRTLASVASINFNPARRLVSLQVDEKTTIEEPYTFRKSKLGSYQTQFVAPAFLVGDKPRLYGYKGTWQRKLADKKVIKLVGKIYMVRKQRFGRAKGDYQFVQSVGTFVARRRVQIEDDDTGDDFYDDEYDEVVGDDVDLDDDKAYEL